MDQVEEPRIERLRRLIEEQYRARPTECGTSFGEILCHEIHTGGLLVPRPGEMLWRALFLVGLRRVAGYRIAMSRRFQPQPRYRVAAAPWT